MKVLLDTNVVLDVLLKRQPYYFASSEIFIHSSKNNIQLFITSTIVTDLYYILSKFLSKKKAKEFLKNLLEIVDVCGVDRTIILEAMSSDFEDLEDAVQYFSSKLENIDVIVTRNKKDFKLSEIKVLTPTEFIRNTH